jgi:hypothetical protein
MESIDSLKPMAGGGIDFTEFEGQKKRIDTLEIMEVPSSFTKSGKAKVLKVITEPVTEVTTKEGKKVEIKATEIFNLKEENGQIGFSTSPKSRLQKLLTKLKINKPTDLKGKMVLIKVREVKRLDGTTGEFLGFHIE